MRYASSLNALSSNALQVKGSLSVPSRFSVIAAICNSVRGATLSPFRISATTLYPRILYSASSDRLISFTECIKLLTTITGSEPKMLSKSATSNPSAIYFRNLFRLTAFSILVWSLRISSRFARTIQSSKDIRFALSH